MMLLLTCSFPRRLSSYNKSPWTDQPLYAKYKSFSTAKGFLEALLILEASFICIKYPDQ